MGHWEKLLYLPPEHRQVIAARRPHLVGIASSFRGRRDYRPCAVGHLSVSERAGTEISDLPDVLHGKPLGEWTTAAGYSAEHGEGDRRLPRAEISGDSRKLPAAHASSRKSHGHGSDLARWQHSDAELCGPLQFQLDD